MLSTNQLGNLGESKAITKFIEEGFDIFTQFSGHNPFDFVIHRDSKLYKVEVKTTTVKTNNNSYTVYIEGTAYGPDRSIKHKPLDVDNVDVLVVYIQPIDTLCFFNTGDLDNKCSITLREIRTAPNQKIISDYKDINI